MGQVPLLSYCDAHEISCSAHTGRWRRSSGSGSGPTASAQGGCSRDVVGAVFARDMVLGRRRLGRHGLLGSRLCR